VEQLVTLFYPDLHRLASVKMHQERQGHTWQPTVLVNELYLALLKIRELKWSPDAGQSERDAFLALAAQIMKRMLISHARVGWKRAQRMDFEELNPDGACTADWGEVGAMLSKLAAFDPKLRAVVELRVFEGLTIAETADRLGCSPRSVGRYWDFARHWLQDAFQAQ
jgi:RNA polymerase sigma factor (TIGR02999 family)